MKFTELFLMQPDFLYFLVKQSGKKTKTFVKDGITKTHYVFRSRKIVVTTNLKGDLISVGCGINILKA